MKKIGLIMVTAMIILATCGSSEEPDKDGDKMEMEVMQETEATLRFSNDRTANEFIEKYNKLYPDDIITEDRVSCPYNAGIYLTIIEFDYMNLCISEADNDPAFRCESILEYNDENTDGFFQEAERVLIASEKGLSEEAVRTLISKLRAGKYPYDNFAIASQNDRRYSFEAPSNSYQTKSDPQKQLTYKLSWYYAGH